CRHRKSAPGNYAGGADVAGGKIGDVRDKTLRLGDSDRAKLVGTDQTGDAVIAVAACREVDGVAGLVLDDRRNLEAGDEPVALPRERIDRVSGEVVTRIEVREPI